MADSLMPHSAVSIVDTLVAMLVMSFANVVHALGGIRTTLASRCSIVHFYHSMSIAKNDAPGQPFLNSEDISGDNTVKACFSFGEKLWKKSEI